MLRNCARLVGVDEYAVLNEVLSLNAQEFGDSSRRIDTVIGVLNEVLSLNAQESLDRGKDTRALCYPQ